MATDQSIFILIEEERIEAIEDLIDGNKVDVNQVDEVSAGMAKWLFEPIHQNLQFYSSHFDASHIYKDGYSPLILATSMGLHDIAEVLLDAKADIDYVAEVRCVQRCLT